MWNDVRGRHAAVSKRGVMVPIPVLLYHKVSDMPESLATGPALFEAHLSWLRENGHRAISLAEFEDHLAGRGKHAKPVLITFDDGYRCLYENAWAILHRLEMNAVAFLVTAKLGAEAGFLNWNEVREMARSGAIEFQSHSHSHDQLILSAANIAAACEDIARSRAVLARELGLPPVAIKHFAWPWGATSPQLEKACGEAGFCFQYLVQTTVCRDRRTLRLPRICCDGWSLGTFSRWITALTAPVLGDAISLSSGLYRRVRGRLAY